MKTLKITIEVNDDIEAYAIVSELGFEHKVIDADLGGHKEAFGPDNKPAYFLRDNKKNTLPMMDKTDFEAADIERVNNLIDTNI